MLIADCSMVDVIGSIVILLSRCCLPNDEGPGSPNIFPRTAPVDSSTRFPFTVQTHRHTVTDATDYPTYGSATAGVGKWGTVVNCSLPC